MFFFVLKISFRYKSTDPSIYLITEMHFLTFLFFEKSTEKYMLLKKQGDTFWRSADPTETQPHFSAWKTISSF